MKKAAFGAISVIQTQITKSEDQPRYLCAQSQNFGCTTSLIVSKCAWSSWRGFDLLPTVQKVVKFRQERNIAYLQQRIGEFSPIFKNIRKHIQFEGRVATIHRHDDTSDPTKFQQATGEMTVRRAPMRAFGLREVARAYDGIARQFARQQEQMMIQTMENITTKTGNIVNGNGQPLSTAKLLELFEKMEHNFSSDGVWLPPTVLGTPEMINSHAAIIADPAFQQELSNLLDRKLNEHRRREAGRNLAG